MFDKLDKSSARCTICKKVYKIARSNTSTLWRHAKQEHPSHLKGVTEKEAASQPTLQEVLGQNKQKYERGSQRKQELDDSLVTLVAQDLQPLSMVSDSGFVNFCRVMDKRYQVPSRQHLSSVLLPGKFNQIQDQVKKKIGMSKSVAVTTDMWTSTTNSSFLTVTCHWWNFKEERLDSAVLDCHRVQGRHTAGNIQEELDRVFQAFEIKDKIITMVTDNGSNIKKAAQDMGYRRLSCFAHSLNLVAMDSIKSVSKLQEVRDKVSKVVRLTKQSTMAKEKLDQIQATLGMTPKKLKQDVPTRWNSLFDMLERCYDLKDAITIFLTHPGMDKDVGTFSSSEWQVIEDAVSLLRPCYEATVELSGEKMSTGSKAIPLTRMLMSYYARAEREAEDGSTKKLLAHKILQNLQARFEVFEDVRILAMATLLDPR